MTVWAKYRYYIDWNNDGDFGDAEEDVTDRVISASIDGGRDNPSQLEGKSITGISDWVFDNSDDFFSSFNAGSPVYGQILPNRRVRITMQIGSGPVTQKFNGFLKSITPISAANKSDATANMHAEGVLGNTAKKKVTVEMHTNITTGAAIAEVLDSIGIGAGERQIDTGLSTIGRWWENSDTNAMDALRRLEDTECGFIREGQDGKLIFEDRAHRLNATAQATYTNSIAGNIRYSTIRQEDALRGIHNKFIASIRTFDVSDEEILWSLPGSIPSIAPAATLTLTAKFPSPQTRSGALAVDDWGIIDIFLNTQADGKGTDVSVDFTIVTEKTSSQLVITLTNNGAVTAYLTTCQARGVAVIEGDRIEVSQKDDTSIGEFGELPYYLPECFIESVDEGNALCTHLVAVYKDPIPALTMELDANANSNHLEEARVRDVSDMIHVDADEDTGLHIDEDFYVERIRHEIQMRYTAGVRNIHKMIIICGAARGHDWSASTSSYDPKTVSSDNLLKVPTELVCSGYTDGTKIQTGIIARKWNEGIYKADFRARLMSPLAYWRDSSIVYASIQSMNNYTVPTTGSLSLWLYPAGAYGFQWHPDPITPDISCGWIICSATGEPQPPLDPQPATVFGLQWNGGDTIRGGWRLNGDDHFVSCGLGAGNWVNIILTWQLGGDTNIYINNALGDTDSGLDATFDTSPYLLSLLSGLQPLWHCFGGMFGAIADVAFYNDILSSQERADLQNKPPNLVGDNLYDYWKLHKRQGIVSGWSHEISTGSNAADMTANNYIGHHEGINIGNVVFNHADLRTPEEGGDLVNNDQDMIVANDIIASQVGAKYSFVFAYPGVWFYAYRLKNKVGWSTWSDGNDTPFWTLDKVDTKVADDGPPQDWVIKVSEGGKDSTAIVTASRPKTNGKTIVFAMFQIRDGRIGQWLHLDSNTPPAHVLYDGSGLDHSYDPVTLKITKSAGQGFGEVTMDSDMAILVDVRQNGLFDRDYCVWNGGPARDLKWENDDPTTATWFQMLQPISYLAACSQLRFKFVRPPWAWDTGGYFGALPGNGFSGKEYWKIKNPDTTSGDQLSAEFTSDPIPYQSNVSLGNIVGRVWFYNTFSASDGGVYSQLGSYGGIQTLVINGSNEVETDARIGNFFVVYVDRDFTLKKPTNLKKFGQPLAWIFIQVSPGGAMTLGDGFNVTQSISLLQLSIVDGYKDYVGGMFNAAEDVFEINSFTPYFPPVT